MTLNGGDYMKYIFIAILLVGSSQLYGSPFENIKGIKYVKAQSYSEKKCADVDVHYSNYLSRDEICKYRVEGCIAESNDKGKVKMYCLEVDLSKCFENKRWKTINELVGLKSDISVGNVSTKQMYIGGVRSGQVCAHYN